MSQLSSKTKVSYVAVLYNEHGTAVDEGADYDDLEWALEDGKQMVSEAVAKTGEYHYAKIDIKVTPVYI